MQPILAHMKSIDQGKCLQNYISERFGLDTTVQLESCDSSSVSIQLKDNQPPHDLNAVRQFAEGFAKGYRAAGHDFSFWLHERSMRLMLDGALDALKMVNRIPLSSQEAKDDLSQV